MYWDRGGGNAGKTGLGKFSGVLQNFSHFFSHQHKELERCLMGEMEMRLRTNCNARDGCNFKLISIFGNCRSIFHSWEGVQGRCSLERISICCSETGVVQVNRRTR